MSRRLAVVLAAGKGTRMKSDLPKVLVPVLGRPMIRYVLDTLDAAEVDEVIVVVGYRQDLVRQELADCSNLTFVEQAEQLGTGHAVMVCREQLASYDGPVLIVAGDSPMLQQASVGKLFQAFEDQGDPPACLLGTAHKADPTGLGRIVRDEQGDFLGIVEEKDATVEQRAITEVNMSTYLFNCQDLLTALGQLRADNSQAEYYVTDCPGILRSQGKQAQALNVLQPCEAMSINTLEDLQAVEEYRRNM